MRSYLDFEQPVADLEAKVEELRALSAKGDAVSIGEELIRLEAPPEKALVDLYGSLTPWQKTQVARHAQRPHFSDYIKGLVSDFTPLAGDRKFADDEAVVGGFGRFRGRSVCVIGQEKGSDTAGRIQHNFGMARPEGYRKAARLMEQDASPPPNPGFPSRSSALRTRNSPSPRSGRSCISRMPPAEQSGDR